MNSGDGGGKERATIEDVARGSGVSTGTVSRVLNNRAGVSASTRERVLTTIEMLDYSPDHAARTLSRRQLSIGLSLARGARRLTPFLMLFMEHLIARLQHDGYRFEELEAGPSGLPARLPSGVILHGAHEDDSRLELLLRTQVPFVLVGRAAGVRWVAPDDRRGGLEATRHLIKLGHSDIVHLGGLMSQQAFQDRYQGYMQALSEAGIGQTREQLLDGEFTVLGGYRAVRRYFEAGKSASAIFAASDEMALGAIAALEDLGLSVPLDVSVVGFDDLPEVADGLDVAGGLTTVRQDIRRITDTAVTLLDEGLQGLPVRSELVPVRLIARGTTARRRG